MSQRDPQTCKAERWPRSQIVALIASVLLVSACASGPRTLDLQTSGIGNFQPNGDYSLSAAEQSLDCRRLTGRIQVRVLQLRDRLDGRQTTLDRLLSVASLGNASDEGKRAASKRDVAILQAYNRALVAKNCRSFDLDAELQPRPVGHTPRPTIAPSGGG